MSVPKRVRRCEESQVLATTLRTEPFGAGLRGFASLRYFCYNPHDSPNRYDESQTGEPPYFP